jgi:DNA ligase-1
VRVLFSDFCSLCAELEGTRRRLTKTASTAAFLRRLGPEEIRTAVTFVSGRAFPASDPRTLEVSWAGLSKILHDLGPAPEAPRLGLLDVARAFAEISEASGAGSRAAKSARLRDLFSQATAAEREILRRILAGEMRVGLHDGLVLESLAEASRAPVELVRRAALYLSDLAEVAFVAITGGEAALGQVGIRLFVPLLPMLAEPTEDFAEVFEAHRGRTVLEYKYDGARIQLHRSGNEVRIWSRRLNEVTASLPEIVELARGLHAQSLIVDGEVVAVASSGRPLPFQELMRRFRRVHEIEAIAKEVPIALYLFDCLFVDGRPLVDESSEARWAELSRITGGSLLTRRLVADDASSADAFFAEAIAAGHEGVVAKDPTSPYAPGSRGKRWFKLKPVETVDCVIVAADRGSGRRKGWLSNYHLAVLADGGELAPVGKTFKGLTDAEFGSRGSRGSATTRARRRRRRSTSCASDTE